MGLEDPPAEPEGLGAHAAANQTAGAQRCHTAAQHPQPVSQAESSQQQSGPSNQLPTAGSPAEAPQLRTAQ